VAVRVFRMVGLLIFLKAKGCPFPVILKRRRGSVLEENSLFGILAFGAFQMTLLFESRRWGPASCFSLGTSPWKPACSPSFPVFFPVSTFPCFFVRSFLRALLLARLVCSDSFASVVYPATSFTNTFDSSICIGMDSTSVLYPVTSSANVLDRLECADIEVFGMPPFVQMSR
jgi:hypothetical protein